MTAKILLAYALVFTIMGLTLRFVFLVLGPMFSWMKKAPYVPSFNSHLKLMQDHLRLKKWGKLVDLGCGDGKAMRFFRKTFGLHCEGYDINPFALNHGRLLNRMKGIKDIKMIKGNFETAPLEKYDYIYVYLFPNQLADIEDRIFKNITDHAIIISNSFKFSKHHPFDTIKNKKGRDAIFLYRK